MYVTYPLLKNLRRSRLFCPPQEYLNVSFDTNFTNKIIIGTEMEHLGADNMKEHKLSIIFFFNLTLAFSTYLSVEHRVFDISENKKKCVKILFKLLHKYTFLGTDEKCIAFAKSAN